MLFLGGGVTAAALLAKSKLGSQPVEPQVMGAMEVPTDLKSTPCPSPVKTPDCPPPMPGEPMPVEVEGDFELPEPDIGGEVIMPQDDPPMVKGDVAVPPPKTGGKPIAPKPNGQHP